MGKIASNEIFHLIAQTQNPRIPLGSQYFFVLSSRHNVFREHVNCVVSAHNFPNDGNPQCDRDDDFKRMEAAIIQARHLALKRAQVSAQKKQCPIPHCLSDSILNEQGPYIIYNGFKEQNAALRQGIKEPKRFTQKGQKGYPQYPLNKFIILDMPHHKDLHNTIGQFISLHAHIKRLASDHMALTLDPTLNSHPLEPRLAPLMQRDATLVIFTGFYHAPRVSRMFSTPVHGENLAFIPKILFHLIDRNTMPPRWQADEKGERDRLARYPQKGWLGPPRSVHFYDLQSLKHWTPLKAYQHRQNPLEHAPLDHSPSKTVRALVEFKSKRLT